MERKAETAMDFSPLITEYFQNADMTQEKFAEVMAVSVTTVQNWMTGKYQPAPDKWQEIISTLGIPVNLWYKAMNLEGESIATEIKDNMSDRHDNPIPEMSFDEEYRPVDVPSGVYPEPVRRKDGSISHREYYLPRVHSTWYAEHKLCRDMQGFHYDVYIKSLEDETIKRCTEVADRILKEGFEAKIACDDAWLVSFNKRTRSKDKDGNGLLYVSSVSATAVTYAMRALIRSVGLYVVFTKPREKHNALFFKEILLKWIVFTDISHTRHRYDSAIEILEKDNVNDPIVDYYKTFKNNCNIGAKVSRRKSSDEIEATIIMMIRDALPTMDIDKMFDKIHDTSFGAANTHVEQARERIQKVGYGHWLMENPSKREPITLGVSKIPPKCAPADTRNRPRRYSMTSKEFESIAEHLAEEFE